MPEAGPQTSTATAPAGATPGSAPELFFAFNRLALQGFGGVLPVAQRELVERQRWLTKAEFVELLSLGQILPGPNIVNMALMFGDRHFGWRGALAALAGLLVAPLIIVLALTLLARQAAGSAEVAGALRGMGVVAAALILSTAWKVTTTLKTNRMGLAWCALLAAATVVAVGVMRWPMAAVLAALVPPAWALAWWKLRP
ncbi:MAG: chromate transporter [Betaproteobacteria bacterium]